MTTGEHFKFVGWEKYKQIKWKMTNGKKLLAGYTPENQKSSKFEDEIWRNLIEKSAKAWKDNFLKHKLATNILKCSILLITRKMKIRTMLRYFSHLSSKQRYFNN